MWQEGETERSSRLARARGAGPTQEKKTCMFIFYVCVLALLLARLCTQQLAHKRRCQSVMQPYMTTCT